MAEHHAPSSLNVHWSKDFVEHLRTVHFTLVAVGVGLLLILSHTNSPAALGQIRQILELKKEWPSQELSNLPNVQILPTAGPNFSGGVDPIDWRTDRGLVLTFKAPGSNKTSTVHLRYEVPNLYPASASDDWDVIARFPNTLAGFRVWWNALANPHPCYFPGDFNGVAKVNLFRVHKDVAAEVSRDRLEDDPDTQNAKRIPTTHFSYSPKWPQEARFFAFDDYLNHFDVQLTEIRKGSIDQDAILAIVNDRGWGWLKGTFEGSFSALVEEGNGLEAEDLEQVERVVSERLARRSEEFDAFGMKFPVAQVTIWGSAILIGIQLYFVLYLRQLSGRLAIDDPGWDVPWICMNPSWIAQAIVLMTVTVLPFAASVRLSTRAIRRLTAGYFASNSSRMLVPLRQWDWEVWSGIGLYLIASVTVLLLGISAWYFRPRLNRRVASHCPPRLFE